MHLLAQAIAHTAGCSPAGRGDAVPDPSETDHHHPRRPNVFTLLVIMAIFSTVMPLLA